MTDASRMLEVQGLSAWYGENHVIDGLDLHVDEGETVAILGRNGAGKTTLLRSITGLVPRREGKVSVLGNDLTRFPLHEVSRAGIGYVPEERGIFSSLTVEENLWLPRSCAPAKLSIEEIYEIFPNLHARRDSGGGQLSGGEQQMLAIARVLRAGATILLLDEPTEGLAPVIVQRIGLLLRRLKQLKLTVILVEQNFEFAKKLADRFYVMEEGRMVDQFFAMDLIGKYEKLQQRLGL